MTAFTIVLPTTKDRAPVLDPVLRHVQLQTVTDWELFIIGDGVTAETRDTIERWCRDDTRMRFFDHPKHTRRGETYRHAALAQARGRNVAYLCDRDLWLFDHLETLSAALEHVDFAHSQAIAIDPRGIVSYKIEVSLQDPTQRAIFQRRKLAVAMSTVGHSMASYRELPFGWRTTPAQSKTDQYMWAQFLADGRLRATSVADPTVLYFNRGDHPGWPSAARAEELRRWHRILGDVAAQLKYRQHAEALLRRPWQRALHAARSWLFWHPSVPAAYWRICGAIAPRTWWSKLRRGLRHAWFELRRSRHRGARRGELPSTTSVRRFRAGPLEAEAYRLCVRGAAGVGASVYARGEELMRFDCFGARGHFHINFAQSRFIAGGRIPRIAFLARHVEQQATEAVAQLRANLRNAAACNWSPSVSELEIPQEVVDAIARFIEDEFNALIADPAAGGTGSSTPS